MGNSFVGFREPECNSPERLGARLPRAQVNAGFSALAPLLAPSLGRDPAAPGPRCTSAGFWVAERRRPGAAYLRLRPACVLPAPGRVLGACRGSVFGSALGWEALTRDSGWAQARTAPSHLRVQAPRAGRHCIYRRRRCREGAAAWGAASRAGQTGGSWPPPGAALRGPEARLA